VAAARFLDAVEALAQRAEAYAPTLARFAAQGFIPRARTVAGVRHRLERAVRGGLQVVLTSGKVVCLVRQARRTVAPRPQWTWAHGATVKEACANAKAQARKARVTARVVALEKQQGLSRIQARVVALWETARTRPVTLTHARKAGLCGVGTEAWLARFGLGQDDVVDGALIGATLLATLVTPSALEQLDLVVRACEVAAAA
jgi:hypothetical protein